MTTIIEIIGSLISFASAFALSAVAAYYVITYLIPGKSKKKLLDIVPFYPKRGYAIILYTIAVILSFSFLFKWDGGFLFQIYVCLVSMIISSQVIKVIAKVRKESII
jgi:hypothetical protein